MARNIKPRRKLSDLYARGVEVRFDKSGGRLGPFEEPATDDEICIWVAPPSPLQREQAMREANAARAKAALRVRRQDESSEEYVTAQAFVSEMSDSTIIEYLLEYESERRESEATREVLSREEWKDFEALRDAMRKYIDEGAPEGEDPEYEALLEADARYGDQVMERMQELEDADRESMKMLPREALERRAMEKRIDLIAAQVFMSEYQRQMCFYSVRDADDHNILYFESAREWADQPDEVQSAVAAALATFMSDASDPKASPREVDGSQPSTPPSEPETSEASIPEESSV